MSKIIYCLMVSIIIITASGCGKAEPSPTPIQSLIQSQQKEQPGSGTYKQAECPFTLPEGAEEAKGECGILTVPEDRSRSDGATIQLPVAVYKSTGSTPATEPVLFLFSNPGPVIEYSWQFYYGLRDMHSSYTFVFLEQRGVGYSKPSLDCPDVNALFYTTLDKDPLSTEVLQQNLSLQRTCREKLISEKNNLSAYTTAASAADIEDLRKALGYAQWNIYAIGYGSLLTNELIRNYPQSIRSVIYEAYLTPGSEFYLNQASSAETSLNLFFKRCGESTECNSAFPNLKDVFFNQVDQLNSHPIIVDATDLNSGKIYKVLVNGNRLMELVLMALNNVGNNGSNETLPQIPRTIYQVSKTKYEQLSSLLGSYIQYYYPSSIAMQSRVFCVEQMKGITEEKYINANARAEIHLKEYFDSMVHSNLETCAIWQADDSLKGNTNTQQVVKSNIPSLLLGGDYPWSSPSAFMKEAASSMSRATVVEFSGAGQVVSFFSLWSDCAHSIQNAFLANPAGKLDTSCAADVKKPLWITLP